MLSAIQIQRMIDGQAFERLITRVLGNGRCEDDMVRRLLHTPAVAPRVGLALALQRLLELSLGRSLQADQLADRLARMELAAPVDGEHAAASGAEIAATSVVANALLDWLDLVPSVRTDDMPHIIKRAAAQCLESLARAQTCAGDLADSVLVGSIVLWQLGDHEPFRRVVRVDDLRLWLAGHLHGDASGALRAFAYAAAA